MPRNEVQKVGLGWGGRKVPDQEGLRVLQLGESELQFGNKVYLSSLLLSFQHLAQCLQNMKRGMTSA